MVLLAGLMGSTRYWKSAHFETVGSKHKVLGIDALGFGRSPWPDVEYTLEDHVSALRRTLVREGATSHVTFVAHSFGTIVAANYAARYPDEVDHLYLLGTAMFRDAREARRQMAGMSFVARLFSRSRWIAWGACMIQDALNPLARRSAPLIARGIPPEVAEDSTLHFWGSLDGTVRNVILSKPIEEPLALLGTKVTFVHGQLDRVTPLSRIQEVAQRIGAGLIVVPGGHGDYLPSGTNEVIRRLDSPKSSDTSTPGAATILPELPEAGSWRPHRGELSTGLAPRAVHRRRTSASGARVTVVTIGCDYLSHRDLS